MKSKFHHEQIYRGEDALSKVARAKIMVCGAGTIGSNLIDTLARQGFTNLSVIDKDRIDIHNINTQVWDENEVGAVKVVALKNRVFRSTKITLNTVFKELNQGNAQQLLKGFNLIVDAFDNSESRSLVQSVSRGMNTPCIHAGLFADYGEVVWDSRYKVPANVAGDVCDYPLARNLAMIVTSILAEEVVGFCASSTPDPRSWSVTLRDLQIKRLNLTGVNNV